MPTRGAWGSPTTRFVTRQRAPQAGNSPDVQAPLPHQTAEGRPAQTVEYTKYMGRFRTPSNCRQVTAQTDNGVAIAKGTRQVERYNGREPRETTSRPVEPSCQVHPLHTLGPPQAGGSNGGGARPLRGSYHGGNTNQLGTQRRQNTF